MPRLPSRLAPATCALLILSACAAPGDEPGDGRDDRFASGKADGLVPTEESELALGVLEIVNQASFDELDASDRASLDVRAADHITAWRAGDDGVDGTDDDRRFTTLGQLDAVPWVGPRALARLVDYHQRLRADARARLAAELPRIAEFWLDRRSPEASERCSTGDYDLLWGGSLSQRPTTIFRDTFPIRACEVTVRDESDRRVCAGRILENQFVHGIDGLWRCWARDGELVAAGSFYQGEPIGPWIALDARRNEIGRFGYRNGDPSAEVPMPTSRDVFQPDDRPDPVSHYVPLMAAHGLSFVFDDGDRTRRRVLVIEGPDGEPAAVSPDLAPLQFFFTASLTLEVRGDHGENGLRDGWWSFASGAGRGWLLRVWYDDGVPRRWSLHARENALDSGTFAAGEGPFWDHDPCRAMRWDECPVLDPAAG